MGIRVFSYLSVDALAGKTANAAFKYAAGNELAAILRWSAATFLLLRALLERAPRRRKTAAMQERIRRLETSPARTGAGLLPDGRTNPKERLDVDCRRISGRCPDLDLRDRVDLVLLRTLVVPLGRHVEASPACRPQIGC